jgi:hypothetical protein
MAVKAERRKKGRVEERCKVWVLLGNKTLMWGW